MNELPNSLNWRELLPNCPTCLESLNNTSLKLWSKDHSNQIVAFERSFDQLNDDEQQQVFESWASKLYYKCNMHGGDYFVKHNKFNAEDFKRASRRIPTE